MKELFEKFRGLPLTVKMAIVFLTMVVLTAVIVEPAITLPFLLIVATVGSIMRILIYTVENK